MSRLKDVNDKNIADAIAMGCRTMQSVFNADDGDIPYFGSCVHPEAYLCFSSCHSEAHIPGRHLNALLNAEDAIGLKLNEESVEKHRNAAFFSYSGKVALPLNRQKIGGPLVNFCPHNLREGFHALYALIRFRNDKKALVLAEKSLSVILKFWSAEHGWDVKSLKNMGLNFQETQGFIHGEARMIGPLAKYYLATGSENALKLILMLKEKAVEEYFLSDGSFDQKRFVTSHCHSITCVLSSLAQVADILFDAELMHRVKAFYDNGLWRMRDEIGWSPETILQKDSDHGEANNTGDILETALILGRWGYTQCYHDAERILRCHLLPSQLRDISFIKETEKTGTEDRFFDVARRHFGAFGFPAPYGHKSVKKGRGGSISFNMDIVGGVIGSLCEAYRETVRSEKKGHFVNLLFDHETSDIKILSPYTHNGLKILVKNRGSLFIRIPPWLNYDEVVIRSNEDKPIWSNGYLLFGDVNENTEIQLLYPLKTTDLTLSGHLHTAPIRVKLMGDEVTGMDSFDSELRFFAAY